MVMQPARPTDDCQLPLDTLIQRRQNRPSTMQICPLMPPELKFCFPNSELANIFHAQSRVLSGTTHMHSSPANPQCQFSGGACLGKFLIETEESYSDLCVSLLTYSSCNLHHPPLFRPCRDPQGCLLSFQGGWPSPNFNRPDGSCLET